MYFIFELKNIIEVKWIENKVPSDLYECLKLNDKDQISYLQCGKDYYTVGEYINLFIKLKGNL